MLHSDLIQRIDDISSIARLDRDYRATRNALEMLALDIQREGVREARQCAKCGTPEGANLGVCSMGGYCEWPA